MTYQSIQEAMDQGSGEVSLRGWCYRERGSNKLRFIVIRDSTNTIQCVVKQDQVDEDTWGAAEDLKIEESVTVHGTIQEDERAPTGYEVQVNDLTIVGKNDEAFPITEDQSKEHLLDKRHLWLRSRKMTRILKIRSTIFQAFREFYLDEGYHEWHAPILQPTQSEGGSTLFPVEYYDDELYLTQSWQLYAETGVFGMDKIFTISPCFRAEKSKTTRHLAEFWMAEMEAAWMNLDELCDSAEECVAYIVQSVVDKHVEDLEALGQDVSKLKDIVPPFPRLTYTEALDVLEEKGFDMGWGEDLSTEAENELSRHYDKPVIITHWPKEEMAFYKPPAEDDEDVALCVDMIAPDEYGEIVGGSQRDLDVDRMEKELRDMGEDPEEYDWYMDMRRFGSVPHSGYGIGVERVISWLCNLDDIKDTIPYPRTMRRYKP
jgi:asparaginyl-tRNA synthetase